MKLLSILLSVSLCATPLVSQVATGIDALGATEFFAAKRDCNQARWAPPTWSVD